MQTKRKRLIHLHSLPSVSRRLILKFLMKDQSLVHIYQLTPSQMSRNYQISIKKALKLYDELHDPSRIKQLALYEKQYSIITIFDQNYPKLLKQIKDPPLVLYTYGNIALLQRFPVISVIGTRKPSSDAKAKVQTIISPLIDKRWVIVSGMAIGIDSYAHELTLAKKGETIAVLGSGLKHIYPQVNIPLCRQIANQGLVITEYPPDIPPKRYHFPERNRIISGLSLATLVIEATEKSGTLITVDQALDQGRDVYAVPGSPLRPQTKGCHKLIQEGAKLVVDAKDILEDWESMKLRYISY